MDWNLAIANNSEALKRILATLIAMAGLRGQFTFLPHEGAPQQAIAQAERDKLSPAPTLPRHLHRAVLRLLRPAESAVRRLIIVAARGLTTELPPPSPHTARPASVGTALRSLGIAVVVSSADLARHAAARRAAGARAARPRTLSLPLLDPLRTSFRPRRIYAPAHNSPRIWTVGVTERRPAPLPPFPTDPVNATRLGLRLQALDRALDDLPRQAQRFARWRARRDATVAQNKNPDVAGARNARAGHRSLFRRVWPLRSGRPPGSLRRPTHEVHDVLNVVHGLAFWALERRDSS